MPTSNIPMILKSAMLGILPKGVVVLEEVIKEALANSKVKEKTDLGQTHLIKAYLDLNKWKSEKLSPKVYGKQSDSLTLLGKDASIQVKWQK